MPPRKKKDETPSAPEAAVVAPTETPAAPTPEPTPAAAAEAATAPAADTGTAADNPPDTVEPAQAEPADQSPSTTDTSGGAGDVQELGVPTTSSGAAATTTVSADSLAGVGERPPVLTLIPCVRCYPNGWPVAELGASASCHHGLNLQYGQAIEVPAELADICGLLEGDEAE